MSRRGTKARRAAQRRTRYYQIAENPRLRGEVLHYGLDGEPISLGRWAAMFEDRSLRFLAHTNLRNGYWVSTVWLGLDHGFFSEGPPIIFESMVFTHRSHVGLDQRRYATRAQALAGHRALVRAWRKRPKLEVVT